jgi:hypothetical protein
MFRYRVTFKTRLQVDGFTDHRDLEYQTIREVVTVKACNKRSARWVAVKQAYGYMTHNWPRHIDWSIYDVTNVARIKKVKK